MERIDTIARKFTCTPVSDISRILNAERPLTLASVNDGAVPLVLSDIARAARGRTIYIAPDDAGMRAVAEAAEYFAPDLQTIQFPAWDCLPYDRASPSLPITAQRLAALFRLQEQDNKRTLVITTVNAVSQRTLTPFRIRQSTLRLAPGMVIERERLTDALNRQGYVRTDTVADAGEYAVRGNLVDLTPSGLDYGLRLDFFGDEIETLRAFDIGTQRTAHTLKEHLLLPASEALLDADNIKRFRERYRTKFGGESTTDPLYQAVSEGRRMAGMEHWLPLMEEKMATLFDYLGPDDVVTRDAANDGSVQQRFAAIADYHANRADAQKAGGGGYRPIEADRLYLTETEYGAAIQAFRAHTFSAFDEPESENTLGFGFASSRSFAPERARNDNIYDAVCAHIAISERRTIIASYSAGARDRLAGLLRDHGLKSAVVAENWHEAQRLAEKGKAALTVLPLETGFSSDTLELLTEQDILGDRLIKRKRRKRDADAFLAELSALAAGDLVVHMEHGIGRYEGLMSIPVGESPHDCVALSYASGDKLYVPVENIDVLSRYGADSEGAALDRLGGEAWQRRKSKMKERIRAIAGELLKTAAARALNAAERATIEPHLYDSFADRFPYQETEDQDRVIGEVLDDMASGTPMDRLVCGDVGFGKTEVAMRAAFVAAMSGMQVVIVAPTTLLARQHYTNFVERFKGFPLNIGRLSRLVPAAEARRTKEGLAVGTMDICIGTHALLAKSISFRSLGLVIVDEEQRFGVTHKERLKSLKTNVHMLTLTATPIPRTLQMAMAGLRELSVIQTPPVDRLAVRTYVMPWDRIVIREALLREHYRGGQSFFVAPRIADMEEIETFLRAYVPEIKVVTAHGQMSPAQVEERMSAFYDRKFDVLLSTTIVESGLDIPSANTLIIHRADRFGLAQLYQLRGRVGRSKTRAYAYLTVPENRVLTETAEKRLKVLGDLDSLGAGFQLASHDLDIRGAGNLVGDEQSGHIREVGFELYQSMLEDAILAARAGQAGLEARPESFSPQISVDAPIMIPEDYVPDLAVRMALYRRMNDLPDKARSRDSPLK